MLILGVGMQMKLRIWGDAAGDIWKVSPSLLKDAPTLAFPLVPVFSPIPYAYHCFINLSRGIFSGCSSLGPRITLVLFQNS